MHRKANNCFTGKVQICITEDRATAAGQVQCICLPPCAHWLLIHLVTFICYLYWYILITHNMLLYGTSCIHMKCINDPHSSLLSHFSCLPFSSQRPLPLPYLFFHDDPSDLFREVSGSWVSGSLGEHGSLTGSYNKGIK